MSDKNLVILDVLTTLDIPVDRVLDSAKEDLEGGRVMVIGFDSDDQFFMASSISNKGTMLLLMELAKKELLHGNN